MDMATKYMVARPRPPLSLHAVAVDGYSFPSGHATFSALVIPLCSALATRWVVHNLWLRAALWLCSLTMVAAVGFSRVFLGAHYPSDVLAGWSLAVAWDLALFLTVLLCAQRPGLIRMER
jgi:undecaprenyl-diphosphatase